MMKKTILIAGFAILTGMSAASFADEGFPLISTPVSARAEFIGVTSQPKGTAILNEGENGILIRLDLEGLPPGEHAIHIHETGDCAPVELPGEPRDPQDYFSNAGSHLDSDTPHGFMTEGGPHAGDLPNIYVGMDGTVKVHIFNDRITLRAENGSPERTVLLDEDGAAIIVHEGTDDYESQPTGNAGHRIACAVIVPD